MSEPGPARAPAASSAGRARSAGVAGAAWGACAAWLDERTGWLSEARARAESHVPGGARWLRSLGAAATALLLAQLASGLGLSLGYSPGSTSAWESVAWTELSPLGHLLRGLHARGADLLVLALMLHLLVTALQGAFRAPRELSWWAGLGLAAAVFGLAFTGSLLPWDERSRAAMEVCRGTLGALPLLGGAAQRLLGGRGAGANTLLPRAYALHAILGPLLLVALLWMHAQLARRHGPIAPIELTAEQRARRSPRFPAQSLCDALFALGALALLLGLALKLGAELRGPADPAAPQGAARPEWYFRPLYELLRDLPPRALPLIALLPLLLFALFAALPFLSPTGPGRPARWPGYAVAGLAALGAALGAASLLRDARSPGVRQERAMSQRRAEAALRLAGGGTPPEGILVRLRDQPAARGGRLFERRCLGCHVVGNQGTAQGPTLTDYLSRAWVAGLVLDANGPDYFGHTQKIHAMEAQQLDDASLSSLLDMLYALREREPGAGASALPPALETGRRIFQASRCAVCHELEPNRASEGPTLAGYGSAAWLDGFLRNPASPLYYGASNEMDLGAPLTDSERNDLIAYLQTLETR